MRGRCLCGLCAPSDDWCHHSLRPCWPRWSLHQDVACEYNQEHKGTQEETWHEGAYQWYGINHSSLLHDTLHSTASSPPLISTVMCHHSLLLPPCCLQVSATPPSPSPRAQPRLLSRKWLRRTNFTSVRSERKARKGRAGRGLDVIHNNKKEKYKIGFCLILLDQFTMSRPSSPPSKRQKTEPKAKPVLYSYWRSSCSWRVRICLQLLGADYDYKAGEWGYRDWLILRWFTHWYLHIYYTL